MSVLYLYAIAPRTPGLGPTEVRGLEDAPVSWRPAGDLLAAVAPLLDPPAAGLDNLRVHDRVLRRLAREVPSILPVRFGQVLADEEALVQSLLRQEPRLAADLERVRGCRQMTWRVFGHREPEPEPEPSGAGPGARYLAKLARRGSPAALGALLDALAPRVRAQRIEPGHTGSLLASVYHLVRTDDLEAYQRELEQRRASIAPLRLGVSGPWLPYAFTGGSTDA